ncbi:MAG TPA: O-antigen ligase family protein [Rhodanobacter sp.]|nr:O-antigen ligase family protein [Rhodanobacter sp.]
MASLFVVPLNKPATNAALILSLALSLLGKEARQRWLMAARSPIVLGALLWWVVLVLSAMHTWYDTSVLPLTGSYTWVCWYPLVLGSLLQTPQWRQRALVAFALAMGAVLLISCGMDLGLIPQRALDHSAPAMRNTVFKEYTQQGLALLVFGSMALAVAVDAPSTRQKAFFSAAALLALINIVVMLGSRTAYLTLIPLLAYWGWRILARGRVSWRHTVAACSLIVAIPAIVWFTPPVRERLVVSIAHEVQLYAGQRVPTSTGIRLELWRRTLPIIATAPVFGHGLHEWAPLYRQSIEGLPDFDAFLMGHPHQEMLLILAEQGVVGLLVYLLLLVALARYIRRLNQVPRDIYTCILLIYLTAGLANGLWADFSHRHLFILLLACMPLAEQRTSPQEV